MTTNLVLADTAIWIDYFKRGLRRHRETIDRLIDSQRMATTGVIVAGVLCGSRSRTQFEEAADVLRALPILETSESVWWSVSNLSYRLKEQEDTLPLADIVIAAVAMEYDCSLFTEDADFQRIPDLCLYHPEPV